MSGNVHYSLPSQATHDVSLDRIISPKTDPLGCQPKSGAETVTVEIRNRGTAPLTPGTILTLSCSVDGGPVVQEFQTINASVFQHDTLTFTFATPVDLSALSAYNLTTSVFLGTDSNPANDSVTEIVGSGGSHPVTSLPYTQDFTLTVLAPQH